MYGYPGGLIGNLASAPNAAAFDGTNWMNITRLPPPRVYRRNALPQRANLAVASDPAEDTRRLGGTVATRTRKRNGQGGTTTPSTVPPPKKPATSAAEMTPFAPPSPLAENDFRLQVAQEMALDVASARNEGVDREQIAARMSEFLGRPVSKTTIDNWTKESREDKNLTLGWVSAWCHATGSTRALEFVTKKHPLLARRLRLGEIAEQQAVLEDEKRRVLGQGAEVA